MWRCLICHSRSYRGSPAGTFHDHYMAAHHADDLVRRDELRAAGHGPFVDRAVGDVTGRAAFIAARQAMRDE